MSRCMELTFFPESGLLERTRKVTVFGDPLEVLVHRMIQVMRDRNGVGIAANQVAVNQSLFVVEYKDELSVYVNPEILNEHGSVLSEEGCLSLGIGKLVQRPTKLQLSYQTTSGERLEKYFTDPGMVRIISHEMDHLEGICIADYCNHEMCSCNYVKNRKGQVPLHYLENIEKYKKKLGIGNLLKKKRSKTR